MQANPPITSGVSSPYTRALLAGAVAGTTVDVSLYPIDTLKTRLQSSTGFSASGGFRGIYAGVGSVLVGSAPGAALFFVTYETLKAALKTARDAHGGQTGSQDRSEPFVHMVAASGGEIAACTVRVPTEVVKQRAQAMQARGSSEALRSILTQRGMVGVTGVWRELYRGWTVTNMREIPFTIVQFPLWEGLKEWRKRRTGREETSPLESGLFGSVAGAVAAGVTTPLDVLKTRLMLAREKVGARVMLGKILRENGAGAFFAGMGPRVLWISTGGAIFLGSYQWAYNQMAGAT